jgi:hypothetical protein
MVDRQRFLTYGCRMDAKDVIAQFIADIFRKLPAEHGVVTAVDEYNAEALIGQLAKHGLVIVKKQDATEMHPPRLHEPGS